MEEIKIAPVIDGLQLPGVFLIPKNLAASLLLIPGSLNSDVDGNYAPMFPGQPSTAPHAYKDLALQLASHGIAVLRYAKSGPGTGAVVVNKEEAAEKYRVFPQRMRVAEVFLSELRERLPAVPLFLAGHSEGAVVATLLAQSQKESHQEIRGIVSLSGPAQPLLRLLATQQFESDKRSGKVNADLERQYAAALRMFDDFVASRALPEDYTSNPYAGVLSFAVAPDRAPYFRSLESVDPVAEFAKVTQPALIIQGERDASVAPMNAQWLHRAKPDAQIELFPELQHFYKKVPEGLSPQDSFAQTSDSDPAVAQAIAAWINAILGRK